MIDDVPLLSNQMIRAILEDLKELRQDVDNLQSKLREAGIDIDD